LIEDLTPRDERVPRDVRHDNGTEGIEAVLVATENPAPIARWYEAALNSNGNDIERDEIQAGGIGFSVGPHRLELLTPKTASSPLAGWLRSHGPSPFAATLRANKKAPPMDAKLTHGAALWIE
jgi:hypothetical protein